jgi:hypothetical protein
MTPAIRTLVAGVASRDAHDPVLRDAPCNTLVIPSAPALRGQRSPTSKLSS